MNESKPFDITDWLPVEQPAVHSPASVAAPACPKTGPGKGSQDIEKVTTSIELAGIDLTVNYADWLLLGFALAHELGEAGRSYFHRISRFHPKYNPTETNKKFDNCLKNLHQGTTIKSFFYLAKQAGIDIGSEKKEEAPAREMDKDEPMETEPDIFNTPSLPVAVYEKLPRLLRETCSLFMDGTEKDIFLLSALTVCSGCLPQLQGIYFNRPLSPHLYLFITGPSASGKGTMMWARQLGQSIHEEMSQASAVAHAQYIQALEEYENLPKAQRAGSIKPQEPPRRMLFIPANISSSALTQLLAENNFSGIIFESEADTLSNASKQDWGDSSDIYRKAFHHENTAQARRTNREMIEITNPQVAMCLSGTNKQVHNLMPDVENGLFSRYMYYAFQDSRGFLNPFVSHQDINYAHFFTQKSYEVYHLWDKLKKLSYPVSFEFTQDQGTHFTHFFQSMLDKNKLLLSRDLDANTKRLGVITFRIAMVLTGLRLMDLEPGQSINPALVCSDTDFETALTIATTLESHAVAVYQRMPKVNLKGARLAFFEKLPGKFTRQDYLAVAKELKINSKTADRYIGLFKSKLLDHQYNDYTKLDLK